MENQSSSTFIDMFCTFHIWSGVIRTGVGHWQLGNKIFFENINLYQKLRKGGDREDRGYRLTDLAVGWEAWRLRS